MDASKNPSLQPSENVTDNLQQEGNVGMSNPHSPNDEKMRMDEESASTGPPGEIPSTPHHTRTPVPPGERPSQNTGSENSPLPPNSSEAADVTRMRSKEAANNREAFREASASTEEVVRTPRPIENIGL